MHKNRHTAGNGKSEGPATILTFLGMELDTVKLEIRLPAIKLQRLNEMLRICETRKAGKKRDLLSLIGYLQHAAKARSVFPASSDKSVNSMETTGWLHSS